MLRYGKGYTEKEDWTGYTDKIKLIYDYETIAYIKVGFDTVYAAEDAIEEHYEEICKFAFNHNLRKEDIEEE